VATPSTEAGRAETVLQERQAFDEDIMAELLT